MKSANGVPFSWFLALFRNNAYVDETTFYFEGEKNSNLQQESLKDK